MSVPVVPFTRGKQQVASSPGQQVSPSPTQVSYPQNDKIVQDISECIADMKSDFEDNHQPLTDDNQQLQRFCAKLEYLLRADMKDKYTILGKKKDYWDYICDCLGSSKGINDGIKYVKTIGDYKTSLGKGRAFLRFCLMHNRMADSIQACVMNGKVTSDYFHPKSLWLNHDKSSSLISNLYDLSELQFDLAARGYDLDNAWPSFAKRTQQGNYSWNPPSRADSMSSLISIPIQDHRGESFSESFDVENSLRQEYGDQIDALEQQKKSLQQSVVHTKSEMEVLQGQHSELKGQLETLTTENKELQRSYDRMCLEVESKEKEMKMKEEVHQREKRSLEEDLKRREEAEYSLKEKMDKLENSHQDSHGSLRTKITELEKSNADLQMQVRTLMSDLSVSIEGDTKKSDLISSQDNKIKILESKNQELLQRVEKMIANKDNEASAKMDSVNQMQELVGSLKEVEAEKLRLDVQLEEMKKESESRKLQIEKTEKEKAECEQKWSENVNDLERKIKKAEENAEIERGSHQQQLKEIRTELSDFVAKHDRAVEKVKQLENEKASVESELSSNKIGMDEKEKQLSEITNQVKQMKNEHGSQISDLNEQLNAEKMLIQEKIEQLHESQTKACALESSLQEKTSTCSKLNEKISHLSHENDDLIQECSNLRTELKHVNEKNELVSNSKEENQKLVEEKLQVIKEKDKIIENMLHSIKWVVSEEGENQIGKAPSVEGNSEFSSTVGKLCDNINAVKCKLHDISSENSTLQNHLTENKQTIKNQTAEISKLQKEKHSLQEEIQNSKCVTEDLQQKIMEKDSTVSDMEKRMKELEEKLTDTGIELQKISTQREECVTQIKNLQEEITERNSEMAAWREKSSKTEAELQQSCKTNEDNTVVKKSLEEKIKEGEKIVSSQSQKISELQSAVSTLEESVRGTQNEAKLWKEKYDALSSENGEQSRKMEELAKRNSELQNNIETVQKEKSLIEEKKKVVQTKLFDLECEFSSMQEEKKKHIKELETDLKQKEAERTDLKVKVEEALSDLQNIGEQLKNTSSQLETVYNEKEKLESEKHELGVQLTKLQEEIGRLEKHREDSEVNLRNVQDESLKLSEEKKTLLENIEKLQGENTKLSQEMDTLKELEESESCKLRAKLTDLEEEQRRKDNEWEIEKQKAENNCLVLEKTVSEIDSERGSLREKVRELESELSEKSENIERLDCSLEKAMTENQSLKQNQEEELNSQMTLNSENESLKQEIRALNFQLSSDQIEHEKSLQSYASKENDLKNNEEKLQEKATQIQALEDELSSMKREREMESTDSNKQLEEMSSRILVLEKEKETLTEDLTQKTKELELKENLCVQFKARDEDKSKELKSIEEGKDKEISQLKSDMKQLKKKIVQLTKEKDTLWQQTDRLTYEQKMQSSAKWIDEKTVTNCMGCKAEFTFMVRKHHCRLCGQVFCHNCSNNYVDSTHSRFIGVLEFNNKKSRACNHCYQKYVQSDDLSSSMISRLQEDDGAEDSSEEDQTSAQVLNTAAVSGQEDTGCKTETCSNNEIVVLMNESPPSVFDIPPQNTSTPCKASGEQSPGATAAPERQTSDVDRPEPDEVVIPGQVAANISISVVGQNETDEIKRVKKGSVGDGNEGLSKDEIFHLVSNEEIARSQSASSEEFQYRDPDPNVTTGITINAEELEKGEVNNSCEFWIKAGKSYAVPVVIDKQNTVLCWEFTSHPKDVVFSVTYMEFERPDPAMTHHLVPSCKCDSHKQAVRGELTAKQTGIYTLFFDNTYSRITAKRISYSLWTRHISD
ncbi:FYVE and coiled-coil domain-containing protein 1-like isoform X2 [Ostrea edulis]|uniref:FYVE and coiled-coil domain-containing protein 1-like isoform X2 n=1 Tax=Ostrea edulis TaxID=37623 RepID=UPI0024AFB1E2|nr:FYVE and coiled-coil domain-containing protein 1-like isoform X2 [Ostrea edulis]XP_056014343.1 FYVE and coiled-coil domain-containing protein 1-like isoform X2 [Ostrea edulis]XP_056014349.1 FYVE and coiled-coil domain-containing protein 1-like isoform X2 [Ostrea edulis]